MNLGPSRKILVFAGPRCSGKSLLAAAVCKTNRLVYLELDSLFTFLGHESEYGPKDYRAVYLAMHDLARRALERGSSIVVDAVYSDVTERTALEAIALEAGAQLYVVECHVSPETAGRRYARRAQHYHSLGITRDQVVTLAGCYEFTDVGLSIYSTRPLTACLDTIADYFSHGIPVRPGKWARADQEHIRGEQREAGERLSRLSRSRARKTLRTTGFVVRIAIFLPFSLALLPLVVKAIIEGLTLVMPEFCPSLVICHFFQHLTWQEALEWGTFWMATAVVGGAFVSLYEYFRRDRDSAKTILTIGKVPRYGPSSDERLPDRLLYELYLLKCRRSDPNGFAIPDVPIYFLVPPVDGKSFDVQLRFDGIAFDDTFLSAEAARLGFDWYGFRQWRLEDRKAEYYGFLDDACIRCTGYIIEEACVVLDATKCFFGDYVCSELSVNLAAPGSLPEMRRLFEGEAWEQDAVNLSDLSHAARRFSCIIGVCVLVTTADGHLVLQRRSKSVSEGAGNLSSSASGLSKWKHDLDLRSRIRRRWRNKGLDSRGLKRAVFRELREELNIRENDLIQCNTPFIGAAFNLLLGRDLNFYAHYESTLTHQEISRRRLFARDAWEVASLQYVPLEHIRDDGTFAAPFDHLMIQCNRHLRAALFSFARSGRLAATVARLDK